MMTIHFLDETLSVSKQITPEEIATIKQQGFRSIICNRPDNEESLQPHFHLIEAEAQKHGLHIYHLPVISSQINDNNVIEFQKLLETMPQPILAYCRSGTRCTTLWTLSMQGKIPDTEILQKTKNAGYDMTAIIKK
jgi:sulfide:quinone oxidoreductase